MKPGNKAHDNTLHVGRAAHKQPVGVPLRPRSTCTCANGAQHGSGSGCSCGGPEGCLSVELEVFDPALRSSYCANANQVAGGVVAATDKAWPALPLLVSLFSCCGRGGRHARERCLWLA